VGALLITGQSMYTAFQNAAQLLGELKREAAR
jgi:hypothetical protein